MLPTLSFCFIRLNLWVWYQKSVWKGFGFEIITYLKNKAKPSIPFLYHLNDCLFGIYEKFLNIFNESTNFELNPQISAKYIEFEAKITFTTKHLKTFFISFLRLIPGKKIFNNSEFL